jgi:hypothetical protein
LRGLAAAKPQPAEHRETPIPRDFATLLQFVVQKSSMNLNLDFALRTLIVLAGAIAALVLSLKGEGQALPALAVGGTLGACMMARFGPSEE